MKVKKSMAKAVSFALTVAMVAETTTPAVYSYAQETAQRVKTETEIIEMLEQQSDAYPKGGFEFLESDQTISEDGRELEVTVVRLGDASGEDAVDVKAVNLTALYGEDYEIAQSEKNGTFVKEMKGTENSTITADIPEKDSGEEAKEETQENEKESAGGGTTVLSLKDAKETQTGVESDWENWREAAVSEPTDAMLVSASMDAENEMIDSLAGNSLHLEFKDGEYKKIIRFIVKDDKLSEATESAYLMLGNVEKGMVGNNSQITVSIEDNEPVEDVKFSMKDSNVTVEPGSDKAKVVIERTSGINYFSSVLVSTAGLSATPNEDYIPLTNREVLFQAGESEKTIEIALSGNNKENVDFEVRLSSDLDIVEENNSTTVTIVGTNMDKKEYATSEDGKAQAWANWWYDRETVDGINYSVKKWYGFNQAAATSNNVWRGWDYWFDENNMKGLTYATVSSKIDGRNKRGLIWYYQKEMRMYMGDDRVVYHDLGDKKSNRTKYFTDSFEVNQAQRDTRKFTYQAGSYWWNNKAYLDINELKFYYPDFQITFANNGTEKYTKKTYTATNSSKNGDTVTLGTLASAGTLKKGGSISIQANCIPEAYVERYDIYYKDANGKERKLYDTTNTSISYNELASHIGSNQDLMKSGKYTIVIKPVYKVYNAKVKFTLSDTVLTSYKDGFKNGDVLNCTRLDKIKVVAKGNNNATLDSMVLYGKDSTVKSFDLNKLNDYTKGYGLKKTVSANKTQGLNTGAAEITGEYDISNSYNILRVNRVNPSITLEYEPGEVNNVEMRDSGLVTIGKATEKLDASEGNVVGGSYNQKAVITGVDMSAPYMANFIRGEKALTSTDGNVTKAFWTYLTNTGEYKTVKGDNFVFVPYYGYTLINYHFKKEQKDHTQVGVTGTATVKEIPLFSSLTKATESPLAGAKLNIGGVNVSTNNKGEYKTGNVFDKGDYVGIYMSYDTMYKADNLDISKNRVYNPVFDANTDDKIKVSTSQNAIVKYEATGSSIAGGSGVNNTKKVYPATVFIEDAKYELSVKTEGSGSVVPSKVEFRFYDKNGKIKTEYTQTVQVDGNKNATLTINPSSVSTTVENADGTTKKVNKSLADGDYLTVKAYDQNGKGYFEHQTTIIFSEKPSSMYMFNYEGTKKDSDNAFIKAIGGISLGYDLIINSMSNSYGSVEKEDGIHYLYGIGFGEGYQSVEDPTFSNNAYTKQQDIIEKIHSNQVVNESLRQGSTIPINGDNETDANWGFELEIGVIMDVVQGDGKNNTSRGAWYFNDFVMIGELNGGYSQSWFASAGPVDFLIKLKFDVAESGIRWHFTNEGNTTKYPVKNNATIDLLAQVENEGAIDIHAKINGAAYAGKGTSGKAFIGIGGSLDMTVENHAANVVAEGKDEKTWINKGEIGVTPAIMLKLSLIEIPLWKETFTWKWGTGTAQASALTDAVMEAYNDVDMLEVSTEKPTVIDRDYIKNASAWTGKDIASTYSISDASGVKDTTLKKGIFANSKVAMQDIGNGKYLAVFTDDPNEAGHDMYRSAVYYTVYDGTSWSTPVLIEDDKTNDELPVIHEAGNLGYLIAWSDAGHESKSDATTIETLNDYNISGVFYRPDTNTISDVMEITKETEADNVADSNPHIAYYEGDMSARTLMVYYTKSEYSASDAQKGETVGDVLSPYSVIAYRFYDFDTNTWLDTYKDSDKKDIIGTGEDAMTEQEYEAYVNNWYGQVFLDLAPVVNITESIDKNTDRWATEPVITSYDGKNDPVVTDSAMISFNALSLMAYVLDGDGNTSTNDDKNIYVQIYNMKAEEAHHAIRLTTEKGKIENLQFQRENGATYLYWLQDGVIMKQNISNLVTNCLIKNVDQATGLPYYYVDRSIDNDYYEAPTVVAQVSEKENGEIEVPEEEIQTTTSDVPSASNVEEEDRDARTISGFSAYTNNEYSYVVWTEQLVNTEINRQENQLFLVRENLETHEMTLPVQVTETAGAVYQQAEFVVDEEGGLDAVTTRFTSKEDGTLDTSTGELVALSFNPKKSVSVQGITYGTPFYGTETEDGEVKEGYFVPASIELENSSVEAIKNGMILASGTDDAATFDLIGGETTTVTFNVPVDESGNYKYTLTVKDGNEKLLTQKESGKIASAASFANFATEITGRNEITVSGEVQNDSVLKVEESTVDIGYIDAKNEKHVLATKKIGELTSGEKESFEETINVNFDEIFGDAQATEDGNYQSCVTFYVDESVETVTSCYDDVTLDATKEQMELMKSYNTFEMSLADAEFKEGEVSSALIKAAGETEPQYAEALGMKVKWNNDKNGVVEVNSDGSISAKKAGTTTLTGYVMPQDTQYEFSDGYTSMAVDNYPTLPKEVIKEVSMQVTVKAGESKPTATVTVTPTVTPVPKKVSISKATITSVKDQVYTGKKLTPSVKVKLNGKTLKANTDYTVTYKDNKAIGKATITITGKGTYTGTKTVRFNIVPGKVTSVKISKTGKLTFKKVKGAEQYEIRYATKKSGTYKKLATTKKTTVSLKDYKKLQTGKTYYIKVRAYKTVSGKKVYGSYTTAKTYKK